MKKSGFSLLELLIVMTILAILSELALPNMNSTSDTVKLRQMENDMRNTANLVSSVFVVEEYLPEDQRLVNQDRFLGNRVDLSEETIVSYSLNDDCIDGYSLVLERESIDKILEYNSCFGKIAKADVPDRIQFKLIAGEDGTGTWGSLTKMEDLTVNDYHAVLDALEEYRYRSVITEDMTDEEFDEYIQNEIITNEKLGFTFHENENNSEKDKIGIHFEEQWIVSESGNNVFVQGLELEVDKLDIYK